MSDGVSDGVSDAPVLEIEIWSDVVCPWCYIGKRKFEEGLAQFRVSRPDVEVSVSYRAFQLDPTAPPGVSQKVFEVYAKKFGGPDKANEILAHVTREAAAVGIDFDMDNAQRANTLVAHQLLAMAEGFGEQGENKQGALKERLMKAYFCEGEAVGDPDVLVRLAADVGIDTETTQGWLESGQGLRDVASQLEAAADMGISSVPTFVINRAFGVPGAQTPEYFVRVFEKMAEKMAEKLIEDS